MTLRRTLGVGLAAAAVSLSTAGSALADHVHVMVLGNGQCVIIAEAGGEKYVELPTAVFEHDPNVDIAPTAGRTHPLHVLVHQGVPGEQGQIFVYGTPEADAACSAGYVNP